MHVEKLEILHNYVHKNSPSFRPITLNYFIPDLLLAFEFQVTFKITLFLKLFRKKIPRLL